MSASANAETLDEPIIRKETFKVPESLSSFPVQHPAQATERQIECMNSLLANEFAVFTKTLNYHWNVTGPRFNSVHKFLGEQYTILLQVIDDVAERIREVGGRAKGTLTELKKQSSVIERPGKYPETSKMLAELMTDHESIQIQIKAILEDLEKTGDDPATVDFLTTLLKKHEEMGWMLKSHLN